MIYIDLHNNAPSEDWLDRADILTNNLINATDVDERQAIIDGNENLWRELKGHLSNIRNRKCWYSESINDGSHCHVDHFRPKSAALDEAGRDHGGYWWLAFDWLNYRYSGPALNVRKRDYFPVLSNKAATFTDDILLEEILLLDPLNITDPNKLAFDNEGKVKPKHIDSTHRDYKRAAYSINRYNLNMEGLKEGRRQKFKKASQLIRKSQKLIALQVTVYDIARQNQIIKFWTELKDMIHPDSEYSATAKYCLISCGFDWARDILVA
jgi:uncharacterized protein (TIGR02646 family)